jgi:hypothetical protein
VQGGAAQRHGPELRQDRGRRQGAAYDEELGYLLRDAVPELLDAEAVELILDLSEPGLETDGLVTSGPGPGVERGVPGLKFVASSLDNTAQRLLASEERPLHPGRRKVRNWRIADYFRSDLPSRASLQG